MWLAMPSCGGGGGGDGTGGETTQSTSTSAGSEDSTTASDTVTTTAATTTATTSGDTTSTPADESSTTYTPIFDLGVPPDAPSRGGCEAVDFLFVIDDSSSMAEHQQNLIANFPTFIDGIQSTLDNVDSYQVGIVATDPYPYNPGACILLGALVTETVGGGVDASDMICGPYADGFNYMTDTDDLAQTFACAAQVGTMGNGSERPMEAMVTTVGKSLGDPGECNEGFLRDDALLVVVVITDEYDGEGDPEALNGGEDPPTSTGTPQTWYDAVVAAKQGIPENAAALAITNYDGGACPPADLGHDGANIVEWVGLFGERGFLGGICEDDYGPFFADAIGVIESACANFVPAD